MRHRHQRRNEDLQLRRPVLDELRVAVVRQGLQGLLGDGGKGPAQTVALEVLLHLRVQLDEVAEPPVDVENSIFISKSNYYIGHLCTVVVVLSFTLVVRTTYHTMECSEFSSAVSVVSMTFGLNASL